MKQPNLDLEKKLFEAKKLSSAGKFQKSIKIFLKILKKEPDNYFLLNSLAVVYQLNNQFF